MADESCVLLPGLCDDVSTGQQAMNHTNSQRNHIDLLGSVRGSFFCYKTSDGSFLAYDPPAPDTSAIRHRQLPTSVKDLQQDWMASSFEFGEPCLATGEQDCPSGFTVSTAGIGVVNDAGNLYGGGSDAAPPHCGGCQEEVMVCLSSARSVRGACTEVPLTPPLGNFSTEVPLTPPPGKSSVSRLGCGLGAYKHPWILRNRNLYAHNTKRGTGKYFYLMTIQGYAQRDAQAILGLIRSFAQGFQGMLDIWKLQPACDGRCEIMSGAVSAWMTYSIPVALSVLAQLRAWASLDIGNLPGCIGDQAVLKFGAVSVTDTAVVCCPEPHSGGRCNQNYALLEGWATRLTDGSDLDFATWLASTLGDGVGSCPRCGWPGPDPVGTVCPGGQFAYDDARCKPADFQNYIPAGGSPLPPPSPPARPPGPSPSPQPPSPPVPPPTGWAVHAGGFNCYTGKGGVPVDTQDLPASSTADVVECEALCEGTAGCVAVTRASVARGQCWLRRGVVLGECVAGTGYDTLTQADV
jgi:hypothetical protein